MSVRHAIACIGLAFCWGCVPNSPPPVASAPAAPAAPAVTPAPAPAAASAPATTPAAAPAEPAAVAPQSAAEPAATPAGTVPAADPATAATGTPPPAGATGEKPAERTVAKAGVGKQGQSLKEHTGVTVEAAKAYFNVRQRAVFEIQIPEALKLYEATEGRKPKSHDEFMAKIIAANSIKLPALPGGDKYVYDPERGELMVEKRPR